MNLGQIEIAPVYPLWLILLLLLVGSLAGMVQYRLVRRRLGPYQALSISLLRLGGISMIISLALNPSIAVRTEQKVYPPVDILVDTSPTMDLPGHAGKGNRLDEARAFLLGGQNPLINLLAERFDIRIFAFDESFRSLGKEELTALKPGAKRGDLSEVLEKLSRKNSSAVLLSDGNFRWESRHSRSGPLIIVPFGNLESYRDVLIKAVKAPALAFRGREVSIDVAIRSYGYNGLVLPVLLKEGNRLLTAKTVVINSSPAEVAVSFSFTPEEVGQHNLSVSVPPQFGESLASNNAVHLPLSVVRDKIRILMISGSPSLSYRFMRTALKNDPSIDLLSFVILRTPSDIMNVPLQEQSLIPLPVETLFSKELKNFDLLIFDNFPSHLYLSPNYFGNVREFVREGGGFAMVGGPNLLDEGRYAGTPLGELLPVRLTGKEDYRRPPISPGVRLTRAGAFHPITRLSPVETDNLSIWQEMPPLDGINLLEPKSSGIVLLESADWIPRPIVTVGSYGSGRVLVLATDYSWKWSMGMVSKGKGNWAYLRLMERMVRWVTKDPSSDFVQVTLPEKVGEPGKESEVRVKVREGDFSPNLGGTVSFSVFNPEGMEIASRIRAASQPGEYLCSFFPEKEGPYKVKVETPLGDREEVIFIPASGVDLDGAPNLDLLKMVAESTGGKILTQGTDFLKEIETFAGKGQERLLTERRFPLWGTPYILAFILAFLTTEWYLRRRWGLL